MKIFPELKKIDKALLLILVIGVVICIVLIFVPILPLTSEPEPMNVPAVNSNLGLTFPAQSQVIEHESYQPLGVFDYYAVVRIRPQDVGSFLAQPGLVAYTPSEQARARKTIQQDWQNMGASWSAWTIGHARHYKAISFGSTQLFVDWDDPKFATVYIIQMD